MHMVFGEFTLEADTRQLRRGEIERHLSPKALELLRLLLEHRPRALSKAELHERLWPATFVSDATLTSLVAELRGALGETAARSRFVRTVHRFGYAFKGTATELRARSEVPVDCDACWIVWEWGQVQLAEGQHLLGRDGHVAVWLESPTVSRQHARIRISGKVAMIEDLGSTNGTYVRDRRIAEPSPLVDGDEIRLGSVLVTFRRPGAGHATLSCD